MRKLYSALLILALIFGLVMAMKPSDVGLAQGGELSFDEWITGEITTESYIHEYGFSGTAGEIFMAEMKNAPDTYDLTAELLCWTRMVRN
jgi:hypothetical protein